MRQELFTRASECSRGKFIVVYQGPPVFGAMSLTLDRFDDALAVYQKIGADCAKIVAHNMMKDEAIFAVLKSGFRSGHEALEGQLRAELSRLHSL